MSPEVKAKLEFSVVPVGVIVVGAVAAYALLGISALLYGAAALVIGLVVYNAASALWTCWGMSFDGDDDEPGDGQHGVPVNEPQYAPSLH